MWLRARHICEVVNKLVVTDSAHPADEESSLLNVLITNRSLLINAFKNSGKSAVHRSQVEKVGSVVTLENGQSIHIDDALRLESTIISDVFNCDELEAVELVLTGEIQRQNFMHLTRGLCAVVCYYDTHRLLSTALKMLAEFNSNENLEKSQALSNFLKDFCSDAALPKRLIEVLKTVTVQSELMNLYRPNVNGLGGPKHQQILREIIEETLSNYTDTLFTLCASWRGDACPSFLSDLLAPLKALAPAAPFLGSHLTMWISVLILLSPHNIQSVGYAKQLLSSVQRELESESEWLDECVASTLQLASIVSFSWLNSRQFFNEEVGTFTMDVEGLLEKSITSLAFPFIRKCVIAVSDFRKNIVAFEVVDTLLKNFVALFPDKLLILRQLSEKELINTEELLSQGLIYRAQLHYENFIHCFSDLYDCRDERIIPFSEQFSSLQTEELINFVREGKDCESPVLQVAYLDMIKNLCKSQPNARFIFQLISSSHPRPGDFGSVSWDRFWMSLHEYYALYRGKRVESSSHMLPMVPKQEALQQISQTELAGLLAWIQLAEVVALHDDYARHQFVESGTWICVNTVGGLLASSIPLVLKGALFRLLAAFARDEQGASRIWIALASHSILKTSPDGKLLGIQQELEEKECAAKCYDSSLGFAHLMKALLHKSSANLDTQLLPYLNFITKSIICQFASRSYDDSVQMWQLCSTACDALFNLLNYYSVTAVGLLNAHPQILLLTQCLNDSPLFRSLGGVLLEDAECLSSFAPRSDAREDASLSVLRLLDVCISRHAALAAAIRSSDSSLLIASLDSLLLANVPSRPQSTYVSLIASYIAQSEMLPHHGYRAASIIRELSCVRPSLQRRIVRSLSPIARELLDGCARIASPSSIQLSISPLDTPITFEIEKLSTERVRGETARLITEMCVNAVDSDPRTVNVAYFLCDFDLNNVKETRIENPGVNGTSKSFLHSVVETLEEMAKENPFDSPFVGLYEPMVRFLLRIVSVDAVCGPAVLRFLRSNHDLIYRLAASPIFNSIEVRVEGEDRVVLENTRRMLQGLILHLSAVELSSLLKISRYSQPEKFFRLMLDCGTAADETSEVEEMPSSSSAHVEPSTLRGKGGQLLWKLLDSTKLDSKFLERPSLELLNAKLLTKVLALCIRPTASNVEQCDIEHLNWLLQTQSSQTSLELRQDCMGRLSKEIECVLRYCTKYNLLRSEEASARQLLSGWLSFVNVIAIFAPVAFITIDSQISVLMDAIYLLTEYSSGVDVDAQLLIAMTQCLLRLVKAVCSLMRTRGDRVGELRKNLAPLVGLFVPYLVQQGGRPLQAKIDLYGCLLSMLNSAVEDCDFDADGSMSEIDREDDHISSASLSLLKVVQPDPIHSIISKHGAELVSRISDDICVSPYNLKVMVVSCVTQILREDTVGERPLCQSFIRNGTLRHILDSVSSMSLSLKDDASDLRALFYFKIVLSLFIRFSLTKIGWIGVADLNVVQRLADLPLWKNPPKGLFLTSATPARDDGVTKVFMGILEMILRLCYALCSNFRWKAISQQVLNLICANSELFTHWMRVNSKQQILIAYSTFLTRLSSRDESTKELMAKSPLLSALQRLTSGVEDSKMMTPSRRSLASRSVLQLDPFTSFTSP